MHDSVVIAHLDLDAFFAAVELHRRPELRGRPLVVGGHPDRRGVVATASYAARKYGIRSAMSCAEARRRCPDVVFVPPDIAHYRDWSNRIWALVAEHSSCVEQVGIDPRPVAAASAERVSVSMEQTFDDDGSDSQTLRDAVRVWAARLADRLVCDGQAMRTVTIKLRYSDFSTITRAQTLPAPTAEADAIGSVGLSLLGLALHDRPPPVRLIGLGISGPSSHPQLTLFPRSTLYEPNEEVYTPPIR